MQLIIIHNKPHSFNVNENTSVLDLKNNISNKLNINHEDYSLQFAGKNLDNHKTINDYSIKNNSFIFLNQKLNGGNVPGFPNIGHLIILLGLSTALLWFCYYFFSNIMESFKILANPKQCPPLINPLQKGGVRNYNFWYQIAATLYSALFVIIVSIYAYTLYCNKNLSDWLLVAALGSFILVFLIFYIVYQMMKRGDILVNNIPFIGTIVFGVMSIILLVLSFVIPAIKKTEFMHWSSYLYPVGVVIAVLLLNYVSGSLTRQMLMMIGIAVLFIFLPYTMAYILNTSKLCK
jgi:hypothetical protein